MPIYSPDNIDVDMFSKKDNKQLQKVFDELNKPSEETKGEYLDAQIEGHKRQIEYHKRELGELEFKKAELEPIKLRLIPRLIISILKKATPGMTTENYTIGTCPFCQRTKKLTYTVVQYVCSCGADYRKSSFGFYVLDNWENTKVELDYRYQDEEDLPTEMR